MPNISRLRGFFYHSSFLGALIYRRTLPTAFPTVDGLKYDLDMLICYILTVVRGKSVDKRLLYLFRKAYVTPHDYIQGQTDDCCWCY
jgi:hypothetical protein